MNALFEFGETSITGQGIILDDEPAVSVQAAPTAVTEGEDITVTIARTGSTTDELTVWIAVVEVSDDVTVERPAVTFAAGSATAEYAVSTEDDRLDLGNYEVRVSIVAPAVVGEANTYHAARGATNVVVRDDELPKVRIYPAIFTAASNDHSAIDGSAHRFVDLDPYTSEGHHRIAFLLERLTGGT